ncbi:unnamed protein product [Ranitomeya imitator]|uniref:Protein HIRA n=1 Tax=Ranitomeya imitator TaxID=111125 RepID=A0ABN9MPR6_9NEOB|nr:unnamed protein product [Ranitomeya imitator]
MALEEWRYLLEGAVYPVVIYMDHKNLAYLQSAQRLNPRQARWSLFFARFNFLLHFRSGDKNVRADDLSCSFVSGDQEEDLQFIIEPSKMVPLTVTVPSDVPVADVLSKDFVKLWEDNKATLEASSTRMKRHTDKRCLDPQCFRPGDKVWLSSRYVRLRVPSYKLGPHFIGAFEVLNWINEISYKLKLPPSLRISNAFHVSLLRPVILNPFFKDPTRNACFQVYVSSRTFLNLTSRGLPVLVRVPERDGAALTGGSEKPAQGKAPVLNGRPELTPCSGHSGTMKLLKPTWEKPIFSVDIHPDGTKFATGGQGQDSGKVVIWNMPPVVKEEDEKNESIPKMLCQMDNHLACVNCVRWSNSGAYLASGGDDKLIMVWKKSGYIGPSTVFGSSSKLANVEQWRCLSILRNHSGDVMDVAWSPHDAWLASCSVDNTIVIWNAFKFPEIIATLRGHSGLVKGLTWDPVGKYIASQADDHSLKVWRTMDWQLETSITKPFDECGGTTHVLRLSWSPDGHYLVSAHAMNNSGPTAQIIERDGWKTNMDFVGHRKAVTVVKFNPKIFKKKQKNGSSSKAGCPYCCCAVGSKDRSLSVWLTCLKRPLVVIHDLFDKSIMDISWTLNGLGILVCSMDGSVAYLDFSQDELGDPLSEEEKNHIHQSTYGKSLAITTESQLPNTIIENPEMLKFQQRQHPHLDGEHVAPVQKDIPAPKVASMVNGESLEDIRKNLLKKQVETRTADGRRRITPLCIAQLDTGDFSTAFFNSIPISGSVAGSMLSSQSTQQLLSLDSNTNSSLGTKSTLEPCKHCYRYSFDTYKRLCPAED